jgi:hypothetical protein
VGKTAEDKMLSLLENMKSSFDRQMPEQKAKKYSLTNKVEDCEQYAEEFDYDDDYDNEPVDTFNQDYVDQPEQGKRKNEDENKSSRFKNMAKRFKTTEFCDLVKRILF